MCSLFDTNETNLPELLKEKTIFLSHTNTQAMKGDKKPSIIFGEGIRIASRPELPAT